MTDSQVNRGDSLRLQKFLAAAGVGSRRAAEVLIREGRLTVNGKLAELGQRIDPRRDRVALDGRLVKPLAAEAVTLLMHKPRGVLCSHADPHHDRTVFDLVPPPWNRQRLLLAGRLDKDSEGLLILTSDGNLAQELTHPSSRILKRYRVTLSRLFQPEHARLMLAGVEDEGEWLRAEKVHVVARGPEAGRQLEIHLEHGRKREIRRLLEHFGYRVDRLCRYQIGGLVLRGLGPGRVKPLGPKEIALLREG